MATQAIRTKLINLAAVAAWRAIFVIWRLIEAREASDALRGGEDGEWQ